MTDDKIVGYDITLMYLLHNPTKEERMQGISEPISRIHDYLTENDFTVIYKKHDLKTDTSSFTRLELDALRGIPGIFFYDQKQIHKEPFELTQKEVLDFPNIYLEDRALMLYIPEECPMDHDWKKIKDELSDKLSTAIY